jgi:hypothetical protein
MVSKCANPGCSSVFLYLHAGKIFRMEVETSNPVPASFGTDAEMKKPARRVEFFWLCNECASKMTLDCHKDGGAKLRSIAQAKAAAL